MRPTQYTSSKAFSLLLLAFATTARAQTTAQIFIPNVDAQMVQWDASVIAACEDSTTYAIRCTASPIPATLAKSVEAVYTSQVAAFCDPGGPAQVVTAGPSGYYQTGQGSFMGANYLSTVSCDLAGTTEAVCSSVVEEDKGKTSSKTVVAVTFTGVQAPFIDVTITGGSEKLAQATGNVCVSGGDGLSLSLSLAAVAFASAICILFAL